IESRIKDSSLEATTKIAAATTVVAKTVATKTVATKIVATKIVIAKIAKATTVVTKTATAKIIVTSDLLFNTFLSTTLYLPLLNKPLLFINLTIATTTDDIMNYLKANTKCFEKATAANRWDSKRKRDILPGFLYGILEEKIYTIDDSKFNVNEELTKEQQEQVNQFLTNNIDIFSENILEERQFKQLGQTNIICHKINTDKARSIKQ
ncbi:2974_t:CDS:2, partial [Scutellospora calospora]